MNGIKIVGVAVLVVICLYAIVKVVAFLINVVSFILLVAVIGLPVALIIWGVYKIIKKKKNEGI